MAALLSAQRQLQAIALRVPADYRDVGFEEALYTQRQEWEHSQWKNNPHASDETRALRAIRDFEGRILIVESENDELVPAATVRSYKNAVTNPTNLSYVIMAGATHSISHFPELQKEFEVIISKWLDSFSAAYFR